MTEYQRKIELQSPDDFQYLVSNIRRAAHEKIDKDLPLMAGETEDPLRDRVEEIVHEYINSVIQAASDNISINGMDPSKELMAGLMAKGSSGEVILEEHEPFNSKLFEKAKELARQEENLIEEIAALRRTVPGQIRETVGRQYRGGMELDENMLKAVDERFMETESRDVDLEVYKLERQDEVEANWEKGVKGLGSLMKTMPEMVAKKERAERVEEYVTKGRSK